ncbi:NAD(P)H-dependent oxidoreductase subunit E [Microbaculum marinum]|uniref:NAD(P)H-dependent oxidoreductase subunit E n=2 Tax=Microbaculum marinum TaxID=1764581 RepID=A0AAW9RYK4_9HYPH
MPGGGEGGGKRRRGYGPKGRDLDPVAHDQVRTLLGDRPRRRDLLIEFLHLIQDEYGCLHARHLMALAEEMRLSQAEVYEVATFYAHFDIVKEGEAPPPPLTIRVCDSLPCAMKGADSLKRALESEIDPAAIRVVRAPCMGRCDTAPVCEVGHRFVDRATPERTAAVIVAGDFHAQVPDYQSLESYRAEGGYAELQRFRSGELAYDDIARMVAEAGLRGLGGAGFPAARKWEFVRSGAKPRLMCVNADEGEPGTFKDRYYMESRPHQFLEGMLIAAHAVEADHIYLYLRDEYPAAHKILTREIAALEDGGLAAPGYIEMRRGAGAYICGEESALMESVEGKRGLPRHRPPYVASVGVFGRPTLEHNVETLYWIPAILKNGAEWFASQGKPGHKGPRSYSVSGRVNDPGVKLAPSGISVRELIDGYCGGMEDGHRFAAYLPGGASGGILPAAMGDLPLDFGTLEKYGCFVGSHAVVILSDKDDVRDAAINLLKFFEDESCGQCTPCRIGCEKAVKLMESGRFDDPLLEDLCQAMADASICGLGQAAPNPIRSVRKFFGEETTA